MSPPIRDGSGSSIGSIRLGDGSEISEVRTGAGDVLFSGSAIPDSVVSQGKASDISANDGESISTWPATVGPDLSGNGTYNASGPNNNPIVEFNNELINASISISEPFYIAMALERPSNVTTQPKNATGGLDSSNLQFGYTDNSGWYLSSTNGDMFGGSLDKNPHVIGFYYSDTDTEIRIDGTVVNSNSSLTGSGDSTDDVSLGGYDSDQSSIDIGKWSLADSPTQSEIDSIDTSLADYIGITI